MDIFEIPGYHISLKKEQESTYKLPEIKRCFIISSWPKCTDPSWQQSPYNTEREVFFHGHSMLGVPEFVSNCYYALGIKIGHDIIIIFRP